MLVEKNIKFPEKHYVGFQPRKEHINLGFMTPFGTDSQAKKRMNTVDNWAKRHPIYNHVTKEYEEQDHIPSVIYDNTPIEGFRICHSVNHRSSWNHTRDKWRIEDPRGFELEINSGNLERLFQFTDMVKGQILGECIWARQGPENILVPIASDIYENAMKNTIRGNSKASVKDIKPGFKAVLKNGMEGIYIGYYYLVIENRWNEPAVVRYTVSQKKKHVFQSLDNDNFFFYYSSADLASIEEREELKNPIKVANEKLTEKDSCLDGSESYAVALTSEKELGHLQLREIEHQTFETIKDAKYQSGFSPYTGKQKLEFSIRYRSKGEQSAEVCEVDGLNIKYCNIFPNPHYSSWHGRSNPTHHCRTRVSVMPEIFSVYRYIFYTDGQAFHLLV